MENESLMLPIKPRVEKCDFSDTYNRLTPAPYYRRLRGLDYRLPQYARPIVKRCLSAVRQIRRRGRIRVIDLCCGYAVNAALLNHDVTMDDLYRRYAKWPGPRDSARDVIERDRFMFAARRSRPPEAQVVGVDVADNALAYAKDVGLLNEALSLNLEREDPGSEARALFREADVITVTGGLSYIGHASFERVLDCFPAERRPWVIWFPLRHVDVDAVTTALAHFDLQTERVATLPQRRISDARERRLVLQQSKEAGPDPSDRRDDYLHADCAISRPAAHARLSLPNIRSESFASSFAP